MKYYYHPESDTLWIQEKPDESIETNELSFEEYRKIQKELWKLKYDNNEFPYLPELPEHAKPGKISDFIEIGPDYEKYHKVKYGQEYLLQSSDKNRYYLRTIGEGTQASELEPFIKENRLFVLF